MIRRNLVVKRYSEAFMSYAKATIGPEKAVEELKALKILLRSESEFENFFYNPHIAYAQKCEIIDRVAKGYFCEETRNFLKLLLEKGRIEFVIGICDYVRATYSRNGAVDALLRTSYPVDTDVLKTVKAALESRMRKKMNLYLELDPDLLGGMQIRIGNTIIDGSVKRHLSDLKEKLMNVKV